MGLPLPGETTLLLAAADADTGKIHLWGVIVAAVVGAIVDSTIGYELGKHGGRRRA